MQLEIIVKFVLATASTVFLFISGVAVPPIGVALFPLVPQPVLSFGIKYGIMGGMGVTVLALSLVLFWGGGELAFIYSVFAVVVGLLFLLLGRVRVIEALVFGIAAVIFAGFTGLLLYLFGSWEAMLQDLRRNLNDSLSSAVQMHEKMGFPQESVAILKERAPEIAEMVLQLLPAAAFISLGLVVLFNVVFLCRRFPEKRDQWLAVASLREWKAPDFLIWGLIVSGFALFIPGFDLVKTFAGNIVLVICACYFFQGLAIVAYFFNKNSVPRFVRGIVYLFIVFQQLFTLLVVGLGLFDLWVDFRRLKKQDLNPSQAS
ncbi:MAG: DUF2232 domain-containing protein [Deltaproteobacteria bacterium]|nr:DUF2232 domain-containing protein [Deltaproteobacteria bacterium]